MGIKLPLSYTIFSHTGKPSGKLHNYYIAKYTIIYYLLIAVSFITGFVPVSVSFFSKQ